MDRQLLETPFALEDVQERTDEATGKTFGYIPVPVIIQHWRTVIYKA